MTHASSPSPGATLTTEVTPERWAQVAGPFGLASLRITQWLDDEARPVDGAPGLWRAEGSCAVGTLSDGGAPEWVLAPGETAEAGGRVLKAHQRDGVIALRVLDPMAESRTTLTGIERFVDAPGRWVVSGRFVPSPDGATRTVQSVDGTSRSASLDGTVEIELPGGERANLVVSRDEDGFSLVFADGIARDGGHRFRFLGIGPAVDGVITLDFSGAYLPPCSFSDHYLCPMPAASNRLETAITAGERRVLRAGPIRR